MLIITEYGTLLLVLACIFGFFMAWGIGANDVANAMGTAVGSKALTLKQALIIAAIFEFAGAFLAGGSVTNKISKGILESNIPILHDHPELLVYGMISALLATGSWLTLATRLGWPVSTTHSIIGAIIGFASVGISPKVVKWSALLSIVGSWVITPIIASCIAFIIFMSIQKFILNTDSPYDNARRRIPFYIFFLGVVMSMVTTSEGLPAVGITLAYRHNLLIAIVAGFIIAALSRVILMRTKEQKFSGSHGHSPYSNVERLFGYMMVFTACSMAFAHGSNDVANAVGPLAAVISIIKSKAIGTDTLLNQEVLILGGIGIIVGLSTYGYKVIATIGENITELTPSRGFAAEISAAITVIIASGIGLPISTTQTLVGAVLGVGMARGIAALNLNVIGTIFVSWVVTLPAGAILSVIIFKILCYIFSY